MASLPSVKGRDEAGQGVTQDLHAGIVAGQTVTQAFKYQIIIIGNKEEHNYNEIRTSRVK